MKNNQVIFLLIILVVIVILSIYLNSITQKEHFGFWKEMKCNMFGCGPIKCKLKDPLCEGCYACTNVYK
jgi:hypothetical protein